MESGTTKEDDNHLSSAHDDADTYEEPVPAETLKDVELVVQSSVADGGWLASWSNKLQTWV